MQIQIVGCMRAVEGKRRRRGVLRDDVGAQLVAQSLLVTNVCVNGSALNATRQEMSPAMKTVG